MEHQEKSLQSVATNTNPNYNCPNCEKNSQPNIYLLPFVSPIAQCTCNNMHYHINNQMNNISGCTKQSYEKCTNNIHGQIYSMRPVPLNSSKNLYPCEFCENEKICSNISTSTADLIDDSLLKNNESLTSFNTVIDATSNKMETSGRIDKVSIRSDQKCCNFQEKLVVNQHENTMQINSVKDDQKTFQNNLENCNSRINEKKIYNLSETQLNRCVSELLNISEAQEPEKNYNNGTKINCDHLKNQKKLQNLLQPTPVLKLYNSYTTDEESDDLVNCNVTKQNIEQRTQVIPSTHNFLGPKPCLRSNMRRVSEKPTLEANVQNSSSRNVNKANMEMMLDVLVRESSRNSNGSSQLNQLLSHIQNDKTKKPIVDTKNNPKISHTVLKDR